MTFESFTYTNLDLIASRNRDGHTTRFIYDALRRLVAEQDPEGRITQYVWCECGDLSRLIDPNGNSTEWIRDLQGRITTKRYEDGSEVSYTYDSTGRLKTKTDAKGQSAHYSYEVDDNLIAVSYSNAQHATPSVAFTYDLLFNRLVKMQDGIGTNRYNYYPITTNAAIGAGQLASVDGPWTNDTVTYQYDALGRMTNRSINGVASGVAYDSLGRVASVANRLGNFGYNYPNALPELGSINLPFGMTMNFAYHGNSGDRRLAAMDFRGGASNLVSRHAYAYEPGGNITTWTQQVATTSMVYRFDYDKADQLIGAVKRDATNGLVASYQYAYDKAGNRTVERIGNQITASAHNDLNQLVSQTGGSSVRFAGTVSEPATVAVATNAFRYTIRTNNQFAANTQLAAGTSTGGGIGACP